MNKRGSIFLGITIGIFVFIMGVLFIPFLTDDVTTFRTAMNCNSTSISGGTMMSCLVSDLTIPYLIWFFCSLLIGFIGGSLK